jgi:hypothetical protein
VVHVGLALTIGVGIACAHAMVPLVGTFVSMLSVASSRSRCCSDRPADAAVPETARPHGSRRRRARTTRPPIVFAVFDQLPLTSLLGEDDRIDAAQYPASPRWRPTRRGIATRPRLPS